MAYNTTAVTTYNQASTLQMRSVRDLIDMIEPTDAPLLKLLGLSNQGKFRLRDFPRTKYEWFTDEMPALSGTITEPIADNGATKTVTVDDGTKLAPGHMIKIDSEYLIVSSVAGNVVTTLRPAAGTTGATHADNAAWEIVGIARLENSDYAIHPTTTAGNNYNYTQIFDASVGVSNSEQVDSKYGIADTMAYQMAKFLSDGKRSGLLPTLLQKSFYNGKRYVGSATDPRTMGGFDVFVTSHLYPLSGTPALDLPHLEDAMQACWDDGGRPDVLIGNSWAKRKFSEWFKGTIRTERSDRVGGAVIDTAVTDFGEVSFVHDRLCPTDTVYLIDPSMMGWIEYRPFQIVDLPVTIDGMVKRIIGEYGFVLLNEASHAKISGFSTSI